MPLAIRNKTSSLKVRGAVESSLNPYAYTIRAGTNDSGNGYGFGGDKSIPNLANFNSIKNKDIESTTVRLIKK